MTTKLLSYSTGTHLVMVLVLLATLGAFPTWSHAETPATGLAATQPETTLPHEPDALEVVELIDNSLQLRGQLLPFVAEVNEAMHAHDGALPASYTLRLGTALAQAEQQRKQLFNQALRHKNALYRTDGRLQDHERLTQIIIAMAAAVTLYENHDAMRNALDGHPVLRMKLNEKYPEFGIASNYYDSSSFRADNPEYRKTMADAIYYFSENRAAIEQQLQYQSDAVRALHLHVAQSTVLTQFTDGNVFKEIVLLPGKLVQGLTQLSGHQLGRMQFTTSKLVGNTLGLMRWRTGKLKHDKFMLQAMQHHLQPGDILLEKSPFTLTDKTIPGHFGHVAVYVGTLEQLRELGALDDPMVRNYLEQIATGANVVEALRKGVRLNTLEDFMNVDDVAILRPRGLTEEERRQAVHIALGNVGKEYDFNFDVNTTETIVCSELAYLTYPQVDFITRRMIGSFTISPDDIARQAGPEEAHPLEIVLFAHDGKLVHSDAQQQNGLALYDRLVNGLPEQVPEDVALDQSSSPVPNH